ncbi:MAG: putative Mannose-sensitive agglutinin biosis protein MshI [Rhodocyclales bacterium]|nr:putative Mannose-sensitive agglutinin biosis protein MshI [Rhodocyclales bacterium]
MTRHINLLDPPQKKASPYRTALQMGVPIVLVLLVMGTWGAVVRIQLASVKQRLSEAEAKTRPLNEQLAQTQAGMGVEQVNAGLRERLERAQAQLKARKDIQTALRRGDLGSSQGFSEFMRAFARQTVSGLWLTGLKLENGGHDITLTGRALNAEAVATLVAQLRAEPALRGRSIATMHLAPVRDKKEEASVDKTAITPPVPQTTSSLPHVYEFEISSVAPVSTAPVAEAPTTGGTVIEQFAQKAFK